MEPMMSAPPPSRVLIVEDDVVTREILSEFLRRETYDVLEAETVRDGYALATKERVDLLIVDLNLPDEPGFKLVESVKRNQDVGVIYVTASQTPEDRIYGLENGGDDFLFKPIDTRELLARIRAVMRRYRRSDAAANARRNVIDLDGWTLDLVRRELADPTGGVVGLTRGEFDLFAALVQAAPTALTRDYLLEVAGSANGPTNIRMIDVMISKIRKKLSSGPYPAPKIMTINGLGYRFAAAHA